MTWLVSQIPRRIQADDVELRCYEVADAEALSDAVTTSLSELEPWMPWAKCEPQSVEERSELIEAWRREWDKGHEFIMGIFREGRLVGSSGFHLRGDAGQLEIGYWVRSDSVGEGIATRSTRALVEAGFKLSEVKEIHIAHDKANVKSRRVPEKLGFQLLREETRPPLTPGDSGIACLWSMTRDRWKVL